MLKLKSLYNTKMIEYAQDLNAKEVQIKQL